MRDRIVVGGLAMSFALMLLPQRAEALSWAGVWHKVESAATSVSHAVSATVGAAGSVVRWGVGATAGQVVGGVLDPTIDHAAERLKEAGDHFADHAATVFGQKLAAAEAQFDDIAKRRIDQLDSIMSKRIDQLDTVAEKTLVGLSELISQALLQESLVLNKALDREEQIIDGSLNRVDQEVTRVQGIETDALDRMQNAIRDDVPFAAERVTRQIEWAIFMAILVATLVGFGGVTLFRQYRTLAKRPSGDSYRQHAVKAIHVGLAEYFTVALPIIVTATIVQGSYLLYCRHSDRTRMETLRSGVAEFERNGHFAGAAAIARRLSSFDENSSSEYRYRRDRFLAEFLSPTLNSNTVALPGELASLKQYQDANNDDELIAADLYLRERTRRDEQSAPKTQDPLGKELDDYINSRLGHEPFLGKLVVMSRIRMILDASTSSLNDRVHVAVELCSKMLSIKRYENYPAGRVLRAELQVMSYDASITMSPDARAGSDALKDVANDLEVASTGDPALVRLAQFATYDLSPSTSDLVFQFRHPDSTIISPSDFADYTKLHVDVDKLAQSDKPADKDAIRLAHSKIDSEPRFRPFADLRSRTAVALDNDLAAYTRLAQFAYGSKDISWVVANQQFDRVVRRNQGMREFSVHISSELAHRKNADDIHHDPEDRAKFGEPEYHDSVMAANIAYSAGELLVAEKWYEHARELQKRFASSPLNKSDGAILEAMSDISINRITNGLAYVF